MPWEHCEITIDDTEDCPECGITKQAWTVQIEVTRTFKVSRRKAVRVSVLAAGDAPVPGEPFAVVPQGSDEALQGETDEDGFGKVRLPVEGPCAVRFSQRTGADVVRLNAEGEEEPVDGDDPPSFAAQAGEKVRARLRLANARWSGEEARIGDEVTLSVDAAFDDGTEVTFTVLEHDDDGQHDEVTTLSGEVSGGLAEATWTWEQVEDTDDTASEEEQEGGYTVPEFIFRAEAEGASDTSALLRYKDWFELTIRDLHGQPRGGLDVTLTLADGSEERGATDDQGVVRWEALPPGKVRYSFEDEDGVADEDVAAEVEDGALAG